MVIYYNMKQLCETKKKEKGVEKNKKKNKYFSGVLNL